MVSTDVSVIAVDEIANLTVNLEPALPQAKGDIRVFRADFVAGCSLSS